MPPEIDDATSALLTEVLQRCCGVVHCSDCALWLAGNDHLHPLLGHGPHSSRFIGDYRHPLSEGLISMVFASGQPFCENNIQANPQHSSRLDQQLGIQTDAMIVVPVISAGEMAGVITCVHTSQIDSPAENSQAFTSADMDELEFCAALVGRVLETRV
ncbi:GAF domain-containing protein [Verrucomicrobiaceae bacterium R5-34]|nr:GAF domain-containing protein [Verrucomicrobiaceae bacterium R5-34]